MQNWVQTKLRSSISKQTFILFIAFLFGGLNNNIYAQIYVDADAIGAEDGTSWNDAYKSLQDALSEAENGDQIWIAEGIYTPVSPADPNNVTTSEREATFQMINGVEIYGGFDPGENVVEFSERDWKNYPTILSGDIDDNDTTTGGIVTNTENISGSNSYHVVTGIGIDETSVLNGFTITAGAATGNSTDGFGGAIYNNTGSPILVNLIFTGNIASYGGGMYNINNSRPKLTEVIFAENKAESYGGGMYNYKSAPELTDVNFTGNTSALNGGGMYNTNTSSPKLTKVIFIGNSADNSAGGMFNYDSSPTLKHVIFSGNISVTGNGGGMQNLNSNPTLTNVSFTSNNAGVFGGGMHNTQNSNPSLTNINFVNNISTINGGAMYNGVDCNPTLTNVIVWDNEANGDRSSIFASISNDSGASAEISNSLIANSGGSSNWNSDMGTDGGGNLDTNPIFVDSSAPEGSDNIFGTDDDGLMLQDISPAINTGSNTPFESGGIAEDITSDLAGNTRIYDGSADVDVVDMGAYEFQGEPAENNEITPDADNILYVDKDAGGNETGSSWSDALPELAEAMKWAREQYEDGSRTWGEENPLRIFVAAGTYLPMFNSEDGNYMEDGGRSNAFVLVPNVQLFGGFDPDAGIETLDDDRILHDFENGTILSGDLGTKGDKSDNAYHVVISAGAIGSATLDGLTLSGGYAFADPGYVMTVNDETVHQNRGGGMAIYNSSPNLFRLSISNNSANEDGGGVYNIDSSPVLSNVVIKGNSAGYNGGGMNINAVLNSEDSAPSLTNVVFTENQADQEYGYGGALSNGGSPIFTNVTFTKNNSGSGGGIYNVGTISMTNSIIWGNDAPYYGKEIYNSGTINLYYSLYRDGEYIVYDDSDGFTADEHSITSDPQFTDSEAGDYTLQSASPGIKAGDPDTDLSPFPTNSDDNPVDLAGNPRVKNGTIDIGAYEFQGEPVEIPDGEDGRLLISNQDPYTFKKEDFSLSEPVNKINLLSIRGKGSVEWEGNEISVPEEIPADDIRDGLLTFEASGTDSYGYNYAEIEFEFIGNGGRTSEQTTTLSVDVGTTSLQLTGKEGWRFIGNPSDGDIIGDFLDPIWTQGMAGSDSPGVRFYNIFVLHQAAYDWWALGDINEPIGPGGSLVVYVFSDDNNDGDPEGFPKTLTSGQNWESLENSYVYQGLNYYPDQGPQGNSHVLLANPHPFGINFCDMYNEESVNVANSVDIWDPSANGGNGDYINLNCSVEDVFIAPFQGFWIRTTNRNPELEIPKSSYLETTVDGYYKESKKQGDDLFNISMTISDEQEDFTNQVDLFFSDGASFELDQFDAPKLSPEGLADRWLSFYSLGEDNKAYTFQSLPKSFEEKIKIPLDIQTTESGRFTLDWNLPESHVFSGSYFLRDNTTGEVIELREGSSYRFEICEDQVIQPKETESTHPMSELAGTGVKALNTHRINSDEPARFELLIAASGVDGLTELGDTPEEFTLAQNYPNPFNPTTVISYQLPVSSQVRLEVYDMLGRNVATLVNEQVAAGRHNVNFDASNLSSGVYLYRLQAGSQIMTKKLTILK